MEKIDEQLQQDILEKFKRVKHNKEFIRNLFSLFTYEEKFDVIMHTEDARYRCLTEKNQEEVYNIYLENDTLTGLVNTEIMDTILDWQHVYNVNKDIEFEL